MTHFIDASPVYGSDEKTMSEVRSFQGGRLRMLDDFGRQLLPLTTDKKLCLDKGPCFFAGKKTNIWKKNFSAFYLASFHFFFSLVSMTLINT